MSTAPTVTFLDDIGIDRATVEADIAALATPAPSVAWAATPGDAPPPPSAALVTVTTPFTPELAAAHPSLAGVAVAFTGYAVHTLDAVPVYNAPGYSTPAVAEHALGLALAAFRGTARFAPATTWTVLPPGREIGASVVGIVGTGAIGCAAARLFAAAGARVLGWSRSRTDDFPGTYVDDLPDLVAAADIVSLHLPVTPATTHLFSASLAAALKPDAVLVNTARGAIVDTAAVVDEMHARIAADGTSFTYASDVFEDEPLPADSPLFAPALAPHLVLTHHVAYKTRSALLRRWAITKANIARILAGCHDRTNCVSPDA